MPNLSLLMKLSATKILCVVQLMAVFLTSSYVLAQEPSQGDQGPDVREASIVEIPDLADIIPLETKLTGRLAVLENQIADLPDVSAVQDDYTEVESSLKDLTAKVHRLKETRK